MTPIELAVERLQALLDDRPEDWDTRLVLADALEEAGSPLAAGYRWLARARKRPRYSVATRTWDWWPEKGYEFDDPESNVPEPVLKHLTRTADHWVEYPSRREAEDQAAAAFARALEAGWSPEGPLS